jgi:hypothetical protein
VKTLLAIIAVIALGLMSACSIEIDPLECGECPQGQTCLHGECSCNSTESSACHLDDVWWFDGCGEPEALRQACAQGCQAAACIVCHPVCDGHKCGQDGCGGDCGTCSAGRSCEQGICVCQPQASVTCHQGDVWWVDGCGALEAINVACDQGCQAGTCIACEPACTGRQCGSDGCGGICGSCAPPDVCDAMGVCECPADCTGLECGSDGCGGSCGTCQTGASCTAGACHVPGITFGQPVSQLLTGSNPTELATAHLDGDGHLDLALTLSGAASGDGQLSILLGTGTARFLEEPLDVNIMPTGIAAADLNADGTADLAVTDGALGGTDVLIYLGDGMGGFSLSGSSQAGQSPRAVAVADFDIDGAPDLAIANGQGTGVTIHMGSGDGGFGPGTTLAGSQVFDTRDILAAALDGDQFQDVAVPQAVYLRNEQDSFTHTDDLGPGRALAMGDLNRDGLMDLAVVSAGELRSWLGNGDGTYHLGGLSAPGGVLLDVALADLDGDGILDAAIVDQDGDRALVLLGDGTGGWQLPIELAACIRPGVVTVGDFDEDGLFDLAAACDG